MDEMDGAADMDMADQQYYRLRPMHGSAPHVIDYEDNEPSGGTHQHTAQHTDMPAVSGSGRRHGNITSKGWAGSLVWAKNSRYPWWPALVLSERDVPNNADPPRRGAVPVRLFGMGDFIWLESQRAVSAFEVEQSERSAATKMPKFQQAMEEAVHYQKTGELPEGFHYKEEVGPKPKARKKADPQAKLLQAKHPPMKQQAKATTKATAAATLHVAEALDALGPMISKPKTKPRSRQAGKGPSTPTAPIQQAQVAPPQPSSTIPQPPRTKEQRRLNTLRQLALLPPASSPYELQPCINPNLSANFRSFIPIVTTRRLRISSNKDVVPATDGSPREAP